VWVCSEGAMGKMNDKLSGHLGRSSKMDARQALS
jgi:hypothetical protein